MRPQIYNLRAFQIGCAAARWLPQWLSRGLGSFIAQAVYAWCGQGAEALRENLGVVSGSRGPVLTELCRRNVSSFGAMLADYFSCAAGRVPEGMLAHWEGIEHLETALANGRGVILVTAHLGHWELGGLLLSRQGLPVTVITLEEPESSLTQWRDEHRRSAGVKTIAVGPGHPFSFVEIVQTLRRNELVAMLVDRPHAGSGSPVNFFGHPTEFSTGPGLLWQHTGAAVIPAFVYRGSSGRYTAVAQAPLDFRRTSDAADDLLHNTQLLASRFENIIRQHPDQWFNYVPIWPRQPDPASAPAHSGSGTERA